MPKARVRASERSLREHRNLIVTRAGRIGLEIKRLLTFARPNGRLVRTKQSNLYFLRREALSVRDNTETGHFVVGVTNCIEKQE